MSQKILLMLRPKILIVDDEEDILELLKYNLEQEDYDVEIAINGMEGIRKAKSFMPHLIILDIMMPGMDGIEVCQTLRKNEDFDNTLISFLTARSESFTQISALDGGGDDYITKPVKPNVLKSRIKALLRRHRIFANSNQENTQVFGDLKILYDEFTIEIDGKSLVLPRKEFELLKLLVSKPGKVFKRTSILNKVWGDSVIVGDRTIDVHIRKLREKIGAEFIQTLKGVGYKFDF